MTIVAAHLRGFSHGLGTVRATDGYIGLAGHADLALRYLAWPHWPWPGRLPRHTGYTGLELSYLALAAFAARFSACWAR